MFDQVRKRGARGPGTREIRICPFGVVPVYLFRVELFHGRFSRHELFHSPCRNAVAVFSDFTLPRRW
jgi:hypothetical protein